MSCVKTGANDRYKKTQTFNNIFGKKSGTFWHMWIPSLYLDSHFYKKNLMSTRPITKLSQQSLRTVLKFKFTQHPIYADQHNSHSCNDTILHIELSHVLRCLCVISHTHRSAFSSFSSQQLVSQWPAILGLKMAEDVRNPSKTSSSSSV